MNQREPPKVLHKDIMNAEKRCILKKRYNEEGKNKSPKNRMNTEKSTKRKPEFTKLIQHVSPFQPKPIN